MIWEKEIIIRLTIKRIFGLILAATSVINLAIVGAVVYTTAPTIYPPTSTLTLTHPAQPVSLLPIIPRASIAITLTRFSIATVAHTSTVTPTYTALPTDTASFTPSATVCVARTSWPMYSVRSGDTLSSIAQVTGSTVLDLMQANCLSGSLIQKGQSLRVPHPPLSTPKLTIAATPTVTATETSTPTPTSPPPTFIPKGG